MSVEAQFAIGTLATWLAAAFLLRAAYLGVRLLLKPPGLDSPRTLWAFAFSLALGAISLMVGSKMAEFADGSSKGILRVPATWPVMPFAAWATVACLAMAVYWFVRALLSGPGERENAAAKSALIFFALSALAFWLFKWSGDKIHFIGGAIDFSAGQLSALSMLALVAIAMIVAAQKHARLNKPFKTAAAHLGLIAGSLIFGLPFAWLLITSFKEDRDMSSPNGIVWIPRVQQTVPYDDPDNPLIESTFQGTAVQGGIVEKLPDGSARIDILKPMSMRGMSFIAKSPLKEVPKQIPLVTGQFEDKPVEGKVVKELEDGRRVVEITAPDEMKGKRFTALNSEVQPIRNVGLKWTNYPEALDYLPPETLRGLVYLKNTLIIVLASVIGTLLSSSLVAYAFARLRFPGKSAMFVVLLSTMMLPAAVTLLPTFLIFRGLGWIDTLLPLTVPAFFGSAFNIFLLRQFFLTVPMELEDAAKMDGCSYLRTFWQVMLPQVKPALAVVAIWTFMASWNNFMGPLVYINSPENMPISYALQLYNSDRTNEPGYLMAFATMTIFPVLLVFFFAQKYFIEGVQLSGLGGK